MSLNWTIGANEIGVLITTFINGITTAQLYTYHSLKFKDPVWIKTLAYAIWIIECAHTLILWLYLYEVTVTFYGIPDILTASTWHLAASAIFNGIIQGTIQSYFAWKVWLLSSKIFVTIISWTGCVMLLVFNAILCQLATRPNQTLPVLTDDYRWLLICIGANILAVDTLNTFSLSILLLNRRSGIRSTDKILQKLLVWTVETGLVTTISATVMLIGIVALPNTALWVAVSVFHAKFYSNSLFISLNRREIFRRDQSALVMQTLPGSERRKQISSGNSLSFVSRINPGVESHHTPGISSHAVQVLDSEYHNDEILKGRKFGSQNYLHEPMV